MSFFKKYNQVVKKETFITALVSAFLFFTISGVVVYAWSEPTGTAPDNNSAAPLNISNVSQIKNGTLGVGGLLVTGSTSLQDKVQITGGNPGAGKVLVSDADGNASWQDYVQARKNATRLQCPNGSSRINLNGKTFCGYWKTVSGYCDAFGKSYDPLVACYDKGIGRNHGVSPFEFGCTSWEGPRNNGGPGLKFYCEKLAYNPKDASECTDPKAVVGILNDSTLSATTITTCNISTPYTYKGCADGTAFGSYCYGGTNTTTTFGVFTVPYAPMKDLWATSTKCMAGWTKYINDCI
ncbi:MAG: hypothetical protein K9M11_04445 [Candidatus Pacebacteria bacterium]|nr:hypothetical protein [Candidatus Paceibacterota bacterium]